jgi:hypothetical protein
MKKKHDEQFDLNHPTAHDEATETPNEHADIFNRAEAVTERYAVLQAAVSIYNAHTTSREPLTGPDDAVERAYRLLDAVDAHARSKAHAAAGDPDAGEQSQGGN